MIGPPPPPPEGVAWVGVPSRPTPSGLTLTLDNVDVDEVAGTGIFVRAGFFGGVAAVVDAEDEAVGGGVSLSADGLAMTNPLPPPPEAPPAG